MVRVSQQQLADRWSLMTFTFMQNEKKNDKTEFIVKLDVFNVKDSLLR